jgi:hypothetical protein
MPTLATAGAGFLLAVLWFDLMFDAQVRRHRGAVLPPEVLGSIAAYYRRVTTDARPMNMAVPAAMLVTIGTIIAELAGNTCPPLIAGASLVLVAGGAGLALVRTVKNAKRLGTEGDSADEQSRLARLIYFDHKLCLAAITSALALQLFGAVS